MKLKIRDRKYLLEALSSEDYAVLRAKLVLECWNAKMPHFGGCGPHRYDGKDKRCGYCGRPMDWKVVNAGTTASDVLYSEVAA